ncbi:hypothetical protein [Pseudobacteriovorax antillogorgiicola]|uniref:Tetratricopeptide repeat-containing protein n=1 Tax=Pseudobacteriovorax antillogorgiicola TaxID=1513793 RepID=A0A1Y6CBH6_9BACT|nr:hypothetical protein [Pseudobacteriovorax antillogorgiicola]TCS49412.1 hypothetical protein EDD56_11592 [Pseudobacteriovorax antillogorgiicola]SMF46945.1 hypothetical protein SAMN06296036_11492 [Pseudobacteriovorax antillogorgiicola]
MCLRLLYILLVIGLSGLNTSSVFAKKKQRQNSFDDKVEDTIQAYRRGENSGKKTWVLLNRMAKNYSKMSPAAISRVKAVQAQLLANNGYPILASLYSSESIIISNKPLDKVNTTTWKILAKASEDEPIEYVLDRLALKYMAMNENPRFFENDWNYYVASALLNKDKVMLAREYFRKLKMQDRFYLPAQYQIAIINIEHGAYTDAEARLKAILSSASQKVSSLSDEKKQTMINYAHMALARMYYEQKKFIRSAYHYRKIPKTSLLFYDSLFEQSWALFMSGRPKHALGSLYGAHSPYFRSVYNPESKILESMVYFWMCRYDEARNALADFAEQHAEAVDGLKSFLERQKLTPETTYQVFENLISDVSSASLGISRQVLKTAAERDAMLLIRNQYASVLEELNRVNTKGVFGMQKGTSVLTGRLEDLALNIRNELGGIYLKELRYLDEHFAELYTQAQFLYLELLMGQKEHLLGRELHADNKVRNVADIRKMKTWSEKTQSWMDDKFEYWWDEVGYQIIDVDPLCN